jgi:hypothetical protein
MTAEKSDDVVENPAHQASKDGRRNHFQLSPAWQGNCSSKIGGLKI